MDGSQAKPAEVMHLLLYHWAKLEVRVPELGMPLLSSLNTDLGLSHCSLPSMLSL